MGADCGCGGTCPMCALVLSRLIPYHMEKIREAGGCNNEPDDCNEKEEKKEMKKKKYLAMFWRNDGGWKSSGYNYNPCYVFEAEDDEDALKLAISYALHAKRPGEDFHLSGLWEIKDISFEYEKRNQIERAIRVDDSKRDNIESQFEDIGQCRTIQFPKQEKDEEPEKETPKPLPQVGDEIYVESHFYLSHGEDDVVGGLATVVAVSKMRGYKNGVHFIQVKEHPGNNYNWEEDLALKQERLKKKFGNERAHPDPDDRPEFNKWD